MSRAQQVHSESMHKTTYHSEITLYPLDWEAAAKECRICLSTLERPSNRFVSPCDCNGTLKYVHVGCLREWVAAKESRKVQGEFASKLTCELCMQPMRAET
jgi:E3 ubiquitin-protein ligase DOA10